MKRRKRGAKASRNPILLLWRSVVCQWLLDAIRFQENPTPPKYNKKSDNRYYEWKQWRESHDQIKIDWLVLVICENANVCPRMIKEVLTNEEKKNRFLKYYNALNSK